MQALIVFDVGRSSSSWFLATLLCGLGRLPLLPREVFREFARLLVVGIFLGGRLFDLGVGSGGVRGVMF